MAEPPFTAGAESHAAVWPHAVPGLSGAIPSDPTSPWASRTLWCGRLLLCGWWLLMFIGTHIPIQPTPDEPPIPDKLIHFGMFAALGMLLPLWSGWREPLTFARGLKLIGVILVYMTLDELLQIPVGRSAEWLDAAADAAGGAAGLLAFALLQQGWGVLRG